MIRVGFDDQIFRAQARGGVSRYFVELIRRLPAHGVDPVLYIAPSTNQHLTESGLIPGRRPAPVIVERSEWATWRAFGRPRIRVPVDAPIDLLHHTFSQAAYLRDWPGRRVSTIHDMTPELFPENFRLGNPHFAKRRYYDQSDLTICVSENTRADLERFYGMTTPRATVVHLGVGEEFFDDTGRLSDLPERYVLFVGVRGGYKDFSTALDAFALVARDDSALHLVAVGGGPFSRSEREAIEEAGMASRVQNVRPTDEELRSIYQHADATIFPSRYEGFGLPTLEALASGSPAVLADASCMREVGGEVATYFRPGDAHAAAERLDDALSAGGSAQARALRRDHARQFTWDKVAAETAHAYAAALD